MLLSSTARRRPSLSSSVAANSFSAREFATISRPSVSVRRMGSVTALMIVKKRARSRRSRFTSSPRLPRPRTCPSFCPRTFTSHAASELSGPAGRSNRSPSTASAPSRTPRSGAAVSGPVPSGVAGMPRETCPFARCVLNVMGLSAESVATSGSRASDSGHEKSSTSSDATPTPAMPTSMLDSVSTPKHAAWRMPALRASHSTPACAHRATSSLCTRKYSSNSSRAAAPSETGVRAMVRACGGLMFPNRPVKARGPGVQRPVPTASSLYCRLRALVAGALLVVLSSCARNAAFSAAISS
jgi:hypothetical protein